jgi:hypothetical protein
MSLVFQNIDPPPPSPTGECVLRPQQRRGGTHSPGGEGGGGSIFWKSRDIGLPSYSNNLSTENMFLCLWQKPRRKCFAIDKIKINCFGIKYI